MTRSNLRTIGAFTAGVAITAGAIAMPVAVPAGAAPGPEESTFVPTAPCRLFDTRAGADNVGPRDTPLAQDPLTQQVTGTNGDCTIPTDATAVAMNVTTVNATDASFVQIYPADVDRPLRTSNLNTFPGQAPTPNKVDSKLSATGAIKVYNNTGTVDVLADVVGYYTSAGLQELAAAVLTKADAADVYTQAEVDAAVAAEVSAAIAAQPRVFSTVVALDGTLDRGVGAIAVQRIGAGSYNVEFPFDVSGCAYTATPGGVSGGSERERLITVAPSNTSRSKVFVGTGDADTLLNTDAGFHLLVVCPPA